MRADWLKIVFLRYERNKELARAVDVMMARAKRIYIWQSKVTECFSFFSSSCSPIEIENMCSVVLSSYRDTRESLGGLKNAVETKTRAARVPTAFLVLPNFHSCLYNSNETR